MQFNGSQMPGGVLGVPDWASSTAYIVGDKVVSSFILYRCNTAHTSAGSIDLAKFDPVGSPGGGGSGIPNYIGNGDFEVNASGWTDGTNISIARTTTAGELLAGAGSGKISATSSVAVNDYEKYAFTIDPIDYGRQLFLQFDFKALTGYLTGDLAVIIVNETTSGNIIPSVTLVPAGQGTFQATFIADGTASYSLRFVSQTAGHSYAISIDNVYIGHGVPSLAHGITTSYIRRSNGTTKGSTNTNVVIYSTAKESFGQDITYQNSATLGDSFLINASGIYTISASARMNSSVGTVEIAVGTLQNTLGTTDFRADDSGDSASDNRANAAWTGYISAGQVIYILCDVSTGGIAEVNQIQITRQGGDIVQSNSRIEYAYNSDTTNATDTTSFAYGINGGLVPVVATTNKGKRVRFQTPVQKSDLILLQIDWGGTGSWENATTLHNVNGNYGANYEQVNATDIDVWFGKDFARYRLSDGSNRTWTTENGAGTRWRVIKCANPLAVESAVKEYLAATSGVKTPTATGNYSAMTGNNILLTPGDWMLNGQILMDNNGSSPGYSACAGLWCSANGADSGFEPPLLSVTAGRPKLYNDFATSSTAFTVAAPTVRIRNTAPMTIYLVPYATMTTAANARIATYIYAERID